MASINIYVPDELKDRMAKHNNAKWSAICREAIEAELHRLESAPKDKEPEATPNWDKEWVSESLMALPGTGVVKQLDHTRTQPVPQWVEQLTRNFENIGLSIPLVKGSFRVRDLKQARPKVAILKPGEDWQIAHLHLHTQLTLRYPIESSGNDTKNNTE